jgi:TPR repeat protein
MYWKGEGVEVDMKKAVYHYEKAAIGGHPLARYDVAVIEEEKGHAQRAVKHYVIAAKLGDKESMKALWTYYSFGHISKKELEAVVRSHQAAVDEMKSPQREAAYKALDLAGLIHAGSVQKKKNGRRGKKVRWE